MGIYKKNSLEKQFKGVPCTMQSTQIMIKINRKEIIKLWINEMVKSCFALKLESFFKILNYIYEEIQHSRNREVQE